MPLVSKAFGDIITFTRASTGTFFDSAGVLTSAAIDAPRLDYDPATLAAQGLLIEEARTNLLLYSEQFDNASGWTATNSSVTANATTAPSGTTTAEKLIENTATSVHQIDNAGVTVVSGGTYSASVFIKADTRTRARLVYIVNGTGGVTADANLSAGTIGAASVFGGGTAVSSSIQAINNGWYRCTVVGSGPAGTSGQLRVELLDASGNRSYTGDGTSGLFLWGAQLEAGAFPTSYIPTTTTALTRSADVASVNTLAPWYNSTEGTVYAEVMLAGLSATANQNAMQFSDGTSSNRIAIYRQSAALGTALSFGTTINGGAWTTTSTRKLALGNQSGNSALVENGAITGTGAGTTAQTVNQLRLGSNHDGTGGFANGYLRRITYYPRRLSNAELQAITA